MNKYTCSCRSSNFSPRTRIDKEAEKQRKKAKEEKNTKDFIEVAGKITVAAIGIGLGVSLF